MNPIDVVSNTSPLIFLSKIQSLHLLEKCFHLTVIPEEVRKEWGVSSLPDFIKVRPVSTGGKSFVMGAIGRLHRGELEAVQLAVELGCKVILMDDLVARRLAEKKGLVPLGVLGVLKIAYESKLLTLSEVKDKVYNLTTEFGLYVGPEVMKRYLDSL